jgi:pyridoxine/pyridoxamine 5'-phosphate oxidase
VVPISHCQTLLAEPLGTVKSWLARRRRGRLSQRHGAGPCDARTPPARIVLCKDIDAESGMRFFTNYQSRKGAIRPTLTPRW